MSAADEFVPNEICRKVCMHQSLMEMALVALLAGLDD